MGSDAPVTLAVRRLHPQATLPRRMTPEAAGLDISACLPEGPVTLVPGARALVRTGFALALPAGYEAQVRPRSGLALHRGITVLNAPGTIDSDYRGEVSVLLVNLGQEPVEIGHGERVAQLVVAAVSLLPVVEVDALPPSDRGAGGYGSTGV